MAFTFRGRAISKVGVIGSGAIGPDIALHFVQLMHAYDVQVVVVDVLDAALEKGKAKLFKKVDKAGETGRLKPNEVESIKGRVTFTSDYSQLKGADWVVEAATEDLPLKRRIFKQVEEIVSPETILSSNSSHIEPERIFEEIKHKRRSLCTHYFFPAERNPAMEIIPHKNTDSALTELLMRFYEMAGKFPVKVGSRYGYAIDPIFEGLMLAGIQCEEAGLGTIKQIDTVAARTLGLTIGPFTAQNFVGGNPISAHGLAEMNKRLNPWYRTPERLRKLVEAKEQWDVPGRGEKVETPPDKAKEIADEFMGAYFGMVCDMLDSEIITTSDLDFLVGISLDMKPPFTFMNEIGIDKALALVEAFAKKYPAMPVSMALKAQAASGKPWEVFDIAMEKKGEVALLTVRRPKALNALNSKIHTELNHYCDMLKNDSSVKAVVVKGYGNRAFVAGADIKEMSTFTKPSEAEAFALHAQSWCNKLEQLGKPVVAAINGIAFGGGSELALCCTARVGPKGMKVLVGQPEVNLGLIPGQGATQRLPRLIGFDKASEMIRTANPISSAEALACGYLNEEVGGDVLERAMELALELASGKTKVKLIEKGPVPNAPESLPPVDIGHHSKVIDALAVKSILEGAKMNIYDGLKNEAKIFGECWNLEDRRIGMTTFVEKGAKARAEFIHK
jgi:enoyl-CoA hydratase / 3-hydroxyacyl-CoA dehydrogenase